jgi:hypothetical protein
MTMYFFSKYCTNIHIPLHIANAVSWIGKTVVEVATTYVAGIRQRGAVSVQNTASGRGYTPILAGYTYPKVSPFF